MDLVICHQVELHAFADASHRVMAAVVYARVQSADPVCVSLLMSKPKVTSIKSLQPASTCQPRMTIPRLELRAALIASRLLESIAEDLDIPAARCHAWSDSQVILHWVTSGKPVENALVDGYIEQIQELTPSTAWRYVQTYSNPADVASRGATPQQLSSQTSWWTGPTWLSSPCTD